MFNKLIQLISRRGTAAVKLDRRELAVKLQEAADMAFRGDRHAAVGLFQEYLELDPYNVDALNDLGACFASNGDSASARKTFELAYSLDDSSLAVMVNYAKVLREDARSRESLTILEQAKFCEPRFSQTDSEYGKICFGRGDVTKAKHFNLRAWLGEFDNIRHANGYLFLASYCDIDEKELAAEHLFWASTLRPTGNLVESSVEPAPSRPAQDGMPGKIRIGYWSPDFRNHAVRYFARPLIENHDLTQFEVHIYHDCVKSDAQTDALRESAQHFFNVHTLSDADLCSLIVSHDLDILVELAGHTSFNRLSLLQDRLAGVQMTALGYPPTTGLETIDAKVLDTHIVTARSACYYTEMPLVLASSFWCFDPMEVVPEANEPPVTSNQYITFGCVGNIGKITDRILECWKAILDGAPNARLLIRSVGFYDEANLEATKNRLLLAGLDGSRLDYRKAEGGLDFFKSYDEIDIILDTFPFNGGTTSCFAAYMGVPLVSWAGDSLVSRMGFSILKNLDAPHLSVDCAAQYVQQAVKLASDWEFLRQFRKTARTKFKNSALGNGKLFAREFENACRDIMSTNDAQKYQHRIPALPPRELTSRAYAVLLRNQVDAARRILSHCLEHYPDHAGAHLLTAQILAIDGEFEQADYYLTSRLSGFAPADRASALIHAIRCALLRNDLGRSRELLRELEALKVEDAFDQLQLKIYQARCDEHRAFRAESAPPPDLQTELQPKFQRLHILVSVREANQFHQLHDYLATSCEAPNGWAISYENCAVEERIPAYQTAMRRSELDILILLDGNVTIRDTQFFKQIIQSLASVDAVGVAGARRWARMDWRADEFGVKFGALISNPGVPGAMELQWMGPGAQSLVKDMAVLDGSLLALNKRAMQFSEFDQQLLGADLLVEEDWSHRAHLHGISLAVDRRLAASIGCQPSAASKYRAIGRVHLAEKMKFDPFTIAQDDFTAVSTPVDSEAQAVKIVELLTSDAN